MIRNESFTTCTYLSLPIFPLVYNSLIQLHDINQQLQVHLSSFLQSFFDSFDIYTVFQLWKHQWNLSAHQTRRSQIDIVNSKWFYKENSPAQRFMFVQDARSWFPAVYGGYCLKINDNSDSCSCTHEALVHTWPYWHTYQTFRSDTPYWTSCSCSVWQPDQSTVHMFLDTHA